MEKRNITISLPKPLLKKVKIISATEEKSMTLFIEEAIEERIRKNKEYEDGRLKHLKVLEDGLNLRTKGNIGTKRETLHER
jgi:metal-responsive CopG/Arc/MetJ family transcriptional regulator